MRKAVRSIKLQYFIPLLLAALFGVAGTTRAGAEENKLEAKPESKPEAKPEEYKFDYEIRPLKGKLDRIPVLNSNSPEIVPGEGILLSTLTQAEKRHPEAHLNYPVKGQFGIFFHHINKQEDRAARKVLTVSMIAYNAGSAKATLTINSLGSYVSQPDAPVYTIPPLVADNDGKVYAGQGDRVVSDYVRGKAELTEPFKLSVAPRSYALVTDLPIKVYGPVSTLNGRSYYALANTDKPLQFALIARFEDEAEAERDKLWKPQGAKENMLEIAAGSHAIGANTAGGDIPPTHKILSTSIEMAERGGLAGPREGDKNLPTPPGKRGGIIYGRVSGVQVGANYTTVRPIVIDPKKKLALAFPVSSVAGGTMGTGEVQAAPLVKRYKTSAYAAHGNYCVHYRIDLKINNRARVSRWVDLALSTPLKFEGAENKLTYYREENKRVFFRGVVKITEADASGQFNGSGNFYHLVAHRGEKLPPFARYELEAGAKKAVRVELFYTPDATPPQMLTVDSELPASL